MFFIYLIRLLGIRAAYAFLCLVVLYFVPFAPKATRSIWQYARRRCGYGCFRSSVLLLKNYYRLGQILIDKVAINGGMADRYRFEFENYPQFLNVLDGGTGVVMIGAHVGNWEIGTPFFDKYGKKLNIVMFDNEHERIKEILKRNSSAMPDFKIIPVSRDSFDHIFRITEALERKEYVCFQGDRYMNEEKLLSAPFMGRAASFPIGPFLLASKLKTPVVFYFAMREKHRTYRFHFHIAAPAVRKEGKRAEQVLLEQYAEVLERIVRKYPEQWFNYYDFWK